jgi:hypothetical protein
MLPVLRQLIGVSVSGILPFWQSRFLNRLGLLRPSGIATLLEHPISCLLRGHLAVMCCARWGDSVKRASLEAGPQEIGDHRLLSRAEATSG